MKSIRKGVVLRYNGSNTLMAGRTYRVIRKMGDLVLIYAPYRSPFDGKIHTEEAGYPIKDFVIEG